MAKAVARLIEAATKANERRLTSWGSLEDEADKANERLRKMFETKYYQARTIAINSSYVLGDSPWLQQPLNIAKWHHRSIMRS